MKNSTLLKSQVNTSSYYNEQQILKVWDIYINTQGLRYWFGSEEGITIFSDANSMNVAKRSGILLNEDGTLFINESGKSVSISGAVDYMSYANLLGGYNGITNDLNVALEQIKAWNSIHHDDHKISSHTIIFPYHITVLHWGLGVLSLNFDRNALQDNMQIIELYNPLPDCGGIKISNEVKNEILTSIREIFVTPTITLDNPEKDYTKQQNDGTSCGVISAENGKDIIDGKIVQVRVNTVYETGTQMLRTQHLLEVSCARFTEMQLHNEEWRDPRFIPPNNIRDIAKALFQGMVASNEDMNSLLKVVEGAIERAQIIRNIMTTHPKNFNNIEIEEGKNINLFTILFNEKGNSLEFKYETVDTLKLVTNHIKIERSEGDKMKDLTFASSLIPDKIDNEQNKQKQEDLAKVTTNCKDQIISEIDNILRIFKKEDIEEKDIQEIEESLFRISWRSSEIPVQLRFVNNSPLTEKTWVRLDYLSNSLLQIKDNIKQELFEGIEDDLNKLKNALLKDKIIDKKDQINLPAIEKFISFFYDKYLLEQIADHLRKITDARNGELFLEFLKDEQVCYGTFRALEVLGESFKNLSNNILGLFTEDVRTGFRELRNVIHHNRPKLELIMKYNKDILNDILEESCKMLVPIDSILEKIKNSNLDNYSSLESIIGDLVSNTVKMNINLDSIKDLIKILNTKTILSKEERAKLFDHVEEQDKSILEKIIFRLDKNTIDPIESNEEVDEIIKNLKGKYDIEFTKYIREIIWKAYHKIPFEDYESIKNKILESKVSFKTQDFKNKLIARIENPDKESGKQIITYNEILNSIKKIKFSSSQDEDHLKKLITAYVMDDEKYKDFIKDVSSIDEIIGNSEKKSLNQIFDQLALLKQEMSDQVSIIKKFYYKKFLNDRKSEVLSFIDKILPVPFDINQFKKIDDYEEKLKNLSKISKTFEIESEIYKKTGNLNLAEDFLNAKKSLSALSNTYGLSKRKDYEQLKTKLAQTIEELKQNSQYSIHLNRLDTAKTIDEIMEYINPIIYATFKKQRKSLEDIRTFYLNNFLQNNRSEVENFIQTIIDKNIQESSSIDIQTFKEELKIWIDTGKLKSASFDKILIDLEKINFSHSEDKENLRYFLDTLVMGNDEYKDLIRKIEKFKTETRLENIFNSLDLQDSLEALLREFKILEKNNFDQMDKIEKVILRDFIDKQSSEVINFINDIVLQHPADIFDEIITSETLVDSNLQLLGQKLLFDHTQEYSYDASGSEAREKDFNKSNKELAVFDRMFSDLTPTTQKKLKQSKNDDEVDYLRKIKKILIKIEKLENTLLDLNNPSLLAKDKSIMKLSAQYLLEDIGSTSNGFIKSQDFQDYGYVSISKRQFLILNIARKAMAHHPMYIDDEKLEFYIKQLVLDSQFRFQQLENKTLENNNVTIFSNEFIDFSTRRDVSFEELETKKELIKSIIFGNGFSDQVIVFNKKMGCDIGIQGDAVFIVFPIEGRASFICELELELSYNLNCDIKVYTPYTLTQEFLKKLTIEHQTEVLAVEQFDDFLTTKKFEQIYDDGTWTKARILGIGDVYKNQPISKKDFAAATEVEYVFSQRYKNEQREKTKQFRQDRIDKVKEIEDIIIYKTIIYARKICKVLNEIKEEIGLASLHKLFNILMLDRLLVQKVGEYFLKHEYQIQTKFPELSTITKNGFINYAYDKPEEFFIKFSVLVDLQELIVNKKSAFESLNVLMKKEFDKLGFIISQLRGTEIIEHIKKNIIHFLVKDNDWLLMPAILTNLKEKYCDDSNILKIWLNKNLVQINSSLQKYGYLFGVKNVQIPEDFILLEFSGEVEYTYLQRKKTLTNQLQFEKVEIISQIFSEDLSILETSENTHPDSTGYNYRIPHISNGILGFSSELDQELMHINEQISGGNIGRKPLIPNLFIEDFIDRINELLQQNNIIAIIPRIDTTCRFTTKVNTLKDLLEFHRTPRSIFEEDTKKIADYYEFRHLNDKLNIILCRVNKYIQKAKNLQELISKNPNGYTIQLQQQNLKKIIDIFQQDYEIHNQLVEEIFNSSYVKERIIKILQNPFELQKILTFVQSAPQEDQDNLLKNIISNAISTIKVAIKQEFQVNSNLSKEATTILTDTYEFDNYLATLQKSLVISDQNTQEGKVEKDKHEGYIFIEGKTIPCLFVETTNIDSDYKEVLIGENSFFYGTIGYLGID